MEGARLATRHLLDLGHRTVHHVTGPQSWVDATARMRGWSEVLRTYPTHRGNAVAGDWGAGKGYEAGTLLARDPAVSAIFAANDQTALGVIRGLHDAVRRVPEDVSVVGFDDTPGVGLLPATAVDSPPGLRRSGTPQCPAPALTGG